VFHHASQRRHFRNDRNAENFDVCAENVFNRRFENRKTARTNKIFLAALENLCPRANNARPQPDEGYAHSVQIQTRRADAFPYRCCRNIRSAAQFVNSGKKPEWSDVDLQTTKTITRRLAPAERLLTAFEIQLTAKRNIDPDHVQSGIRCFRRS